jgi:hypothetical protein
MTPGGHARISRENQENWELAGILNRVRRTRIMVSYFARPILEKSG